MVASLISLLRALLLAALVCTPALAAAAHGSGMMRQDCAGADCPQAAAATAPAPCPDAPAPEAAGSPCGSLACLAQIPALPLGATAPERADRTVLSLSRPGDLRAPPDHRADRRDRPPTF